MHNNRLHTDILLCFAPQNSGEPGLTSEAVTRAGVACSITSCSPSATMLRAKPSSCRLWRHLAYGSPLRTPSASRSVGRAVSRRCAFAGVKGRQNCSSSSPGFHRRNTAPGARVPSRGTGGWGQGQRGAWHSSAIQREVLRSVCHCPDGHNVEVVCHEPEA